MAKTGHIKYLERIEVFVDGSGNPIPSDPTGNVVDNDPFLSNGDPDPKYIPAYFDSASCPPLTNNKFATPTATNITQNGFRLNWIAASVSSYRIYLNDTFYTKITNAATTNLVITGLPSGSISHWAIYGNGATIKERSDNLKVTTL